MERQHLHDALSQLNHLRRGADSDDGGLVAVVQSAVNGVPGSEYAGISLVDAQGDISSAGATHEYAIALDRAQSEVNEGPCRSAAWENHVIVIDDLASDRRWPAFRKLALARTPIRSVLAIELHTEAKSMAALNFLAQSAGAFDSDSVELGVIYAANVTLAWNSTRREQQFRSALASRDLIGQAKGILMERHDIGAMAAFELLRRLSQETNVKLVDIAEQVVLKRDP